MSDYTGMYRASVQDINDPEDRGRLRLMIPAVLGDAVSGWAEPDLPTKKQPRWEVGDRAWALFEDGDLNRPVYRSRQAIHPEDLADDFTLKGMTYCGTDTHTVSKKNEVYGYFVMYLSHSDIVEDEALEVYVNGVTLGPDWWTLNSEKGIVTVTLPSWIKEGVDFRFGYWWRKNASTPPADPVPIEPMVISHTTAYASYATATKTIPIPAAVANTKGVLLVFAGASGYGVGVTCVDSRMIEVPGVPDVWGRGCGVWYGVTDGTNRPLDISIQGNENATGQFAIGVLAAFEGAGGEPLWVSGSSISPESSDTTSPLVAPPSSNGSIAVYFASGGIGGVYGAQDWTKSSPYAVAPTVSGSTDKTITEDSSYIEIDFSIAFDPNNPIGNATTPNTNTDTGWGAVTLGLYGMDVIE